MSNVPNVWANTSSRPALLLVITEISRDMCGRILRTTPVGGDGMPEKTPIVRRANMFSSSSSCLRMREVASSLIPLSNVLKLFFNESRSRLIQLILMPCLLYTSDAADDLLCVDLGGRRII